MLFMRTIIYVDGFNLYYRLLKDHPVLKWLNLKSLAEKLLRPNNRIVGVHYFTARVSGRVDAMAPARQQIYLDALRAVPEITVHFGTFLTSKIYMSLVHPPDFSPQTVLPRPWPRRVRVIKTEEKGSDVNLACHLLLDGFQNNYDAAAVLSNDSDLVEPIRIATQVLRKPVGLLTPVDNPNPQLQRAASFVRRISVSDLAASQFSDPVRHPDGTAIGKPMAWN